MFDRLAHYNILGRLGTGGMGELYRARDAKHGRTVALRILPRTITENDERRRRFLRDAENAAALSHPNIATLYEVGEDNGQLFAAFEFVPGDSLKTLIAAGPVNPRRAVQAAAQVADALAEGHARGMIHGALDADHVVITPKGNAKVLDFGLTSWSATARDRADETVDARDDLSALGVLLQDMARGSPSAGPRRVVPEIDRVVAKALCDDPDERYDSAATLAADLRAVDAALAAEHAKQAEAKETIPPHLTSRASSKTPRFLAALAVVALVAGSAWVERDRLANTWRRAAAAPPRPVVVVMPFEQPGGSRDYVSVGIAQDVAARLGQTPGLQVMGRSGSVQPATAAVDLARAVNAAVALEGTVRVVSSGVAIAARLVEASTGDVIWRGEYQRELKDVFPLHSQIADDVTRAMGIAVTPTAAGERAAARVVDPAAYDAYLRGRKAFAETHLADAEQFLAQAVDVDDGLAEAHALLAATLYRIAAKDEAGADSMRQRAKRAADRAIELAPDLPAANLATGMLAESLPAALEALKAAIRYDPSYADAYREISEQIDDFDSERADRFRRRALAIDPASAVEAGGRTEWTADSCEAAVLEVADKAARRPSAAARARLTAAIDAGNAAAARPHAVRCAVLCAAALGDASAAASLLTRIATNDPLLRVWSTHTGGLTGSAVLRGGIYPWPRVADHPAFIAAKAALAQAYDKARLQIAAALDGVAF